MPQQEATVPLSSQSLDSAMILSPPSVHRRPATEYSVAIERRAGPVLCKYIHSKGGT